MVDRLFRVLVFFALLVAGTDVQAEVGNGPSRFLCFPFDSSSAGKYAYLADGIHSMLASRLAAKSGIQLVDYIGREAELKSLETAVAKGQQVKGVFETLQADYLVSGAAYATDTGLKIQVVISARTNKSNPYNFTGIAESEEQVIAVINTLADNIADTIVAAQQRSDSSVSTGQVSDGMAGFQTEHPEKQYKRGMLGGGAIVSSEGSTIEPTAEGMKRSATIPVLVAAMDTGDIDGDGNVEIIFASKTEIQVFRYREGRFLKVGSHALRPTYRIHAVTTADLDKDGKAEIYVSANERFRVASMILQWSPANTISVRQENIAWFLRPMEVPGEGVVLVGQMSGTESREGFVRPGLFLLERKEGGRFKRGARLPVPEKFNLFDFVWADLNGDKKAELVAIDRNEKLLVYDASSNLIFVSEGAYGGSTNYLGPANLDRMPNRSGASAAGEDSDRELAFVPTRLLARDIDGDGKQEIIIGRNKRVTPLFLRNFREYEGGNIACLGWSDSALTEMWRTNTITGYIADYSFVLADREAKDGKADGRAQLYVGQIPGDTFLGLVAAKESKMLVYEMQLPGK